MHIKGTELFVKSLKEEGVDTLFGYPGGKAIHIFDALYDEDSINIILPRHEQALIHEAEGYARATGKVGVCLVTSGPGATNLVTGIADANYDSIPLVCFTAQVPRNLIGNDSFQEVDIVGVTRSISKYSVTVRNRKDFGRIIKEAFYIARTGKPGPVVVDLPEDVMLEIGDDVYKEDINIRGYKPNTEVHVGQVKRAAELLQKSKKPLFLIGGGVNIAGCKDEFTKLVEKTKIPVVTTVMGKGAIDTDNKFYIGNIGMHGSFAGNKAISNCDVLFSIGTRFNDRITGKIEEFAKNAKIIHVDIDSASISRNIKVDIPIVADAKKFMPVMLQYVKNYKTEEWIKEIEAWDSEHPLSLSAPEGISPRKVIDTVNKVYNNEIVVTDVGQHQMWTCQFIDLKDKAQLITSGGLGTMGFGLPAAIGAKIGDKTRDVICISGDAGMQMNIQELVTAASNELPITICILNNSYLGMVRQWQKLFFHKRYSSTCTRRIKECDKRCKGPSDKCPPYSPDFIKIADAYGIKGIRVTDENNLLEAFKEAKENKKGPTLIEIIIDAEDIVLPMVQGGKALDNMILE